VDEHLHHAVRVQLVLGPLVHARNESYLRGARAHSEYTPPAAVQKLKAPSATALLGGQALRHFVVVLPNVMKTLLHLQRAQPNPLRELGHLLLFAPQAAVPFLKLLLAGPRLLLGHPPPLTVVLAVRVPPVLVARRQPPLHAEHPVPSCPSSLVPCAPPLTEISPSLSFQYRVGALSVLVATRAPAIGPGWLEIRMLGVGLMHPISPIFSAVSHTAADRAWHGT